MVGLTLQWVLGVGALVFAAHLISVALAKALRSYSPSRLEELCLERGRPGRADEVALDDERTERSAETLAILTGLILSALVSVVALSLERFPLRTGALVLLSALAVSVPGYFLAGAIGQVHAESVIERLWPLARLLRIATAPLIALGELSEAVVSNLARPGGSLRRPTSVEVEIPSDGENAEVDEPELPESVRELIQQAVELTRRDVSELKTPRSSMMTLPASISATAAAQTFRHSGLSRIPVFGENRDDILGILYAKDLFPQMVDAEEPDAVSPRSLLRPAYCIPESKNAYELLEEFRDRRTQIAIVLDEYGSVAGLITFEDLLEELVGAIDDEHDVPSQTDPLTPLGGSRYEVHATVELEELNERLSLRLPTDGDFLTVGGLALHALGRVPEPGARFRFAGVEFTVVDVADHTIRRVRLELEPTAAVGTS